MVKSFVAAMLLLAAPLAFAAVPPSQINYQGELLDSNNQPLSGTFDMVFRFFDASSGGTLLLTDSHTGSGGVVVADGLYDVPLGSGTITPGSESTLGDVFANHGNVYLELQVGVETLAPRVHLISSAYSLNAGTLNGLNTGNASGNIPVNDGTLSANLNADMLDGLHSTSFAASVHTHSAADITSGTLTSARGGTGSDTSGAVAGSILRAAGGGVWSAMGPGGEGQILTITGGLPSWQTPSGGAITGGGTPNFLAKFTGGSSIGSSIIAESGGKIGIGTSAPGTLLEVEGTGLFNGANSFAFASNGADGIVGKGTEAGGLFADLDNIGYAWVGYGNRGIEAYGQEAGGYFKDFDNSGYAFLGYGDYGVFASGTTGGGIFYDQTDPFTTFAVVGSSGQGIAGFGSAAGGYFSSSFTNSGYGVTAYGGTAGGYFQDSDNSGYGYIGYSDTGIVGYGNGAGAYLKDADSSGYAYVGYADQGIQAYGDAAGGIFQGGFYGLTSYGTNTGGFFQETTNGSFARLGYLDRGIDATGSGTGGCLGNSSTNSFACIGFLDEKINGNGRVSFMQNHPAEKDKVIVYTAPEGDEAATYTRGRARLQNGVARISLGKTFPWVTNPDIGLTGYVTPRENCEGIYIESITPAEMIVRELRNGTSNAVFDYIVYGLRIGFEEATIVQQKQRDAPIPSMAWRNELYQKHPELSEYNALERFKQMRTAVGETTPLDFTASKTLHDAIHEFDPAVDEIEKPAAFKSTEEAAIRPPQINAPRISGRKFVASGQPSSSTSGASTEHSAGSSAGVLLDRDHETATAPKLPVDSDGNAYAKSFRSQAGDFAKTMQVSQRVEAGDVLVVDRDNPDWLRPSDAAGDSAVVGIVAGEPGVVLGATRESSRKSQPTDAPVAISGIVQCKVDAAYGPIQIGDLLTTSATPGYAMRAQNPAPGTIIGKALQPWNTGTGVIRIVIMHQ